MTRPKPAIWPAEQADAAAFWSILKPILRSGETYALPRDWSLEQAIDYWLQPAHRAFLALDEDRMLGAYYLRSNQLGSGDHVANAAYATHPEAAGRGVARAMALHSFATARAAGFAAMQFNIVVATNTRAVRLWQDLGFREVGPLSAAFPHPRLGPVDALVMHRVL